MGNSRACASAVAAAAWFAMSTTALSQSTLPSLETQSAIQSLPLAAQNRGGPQNAVPDLKHFTVDPKNLPQSSRQELKLNEQGQANTPALVPNMILLQFDPTASKAAIEDFLKRRNLSVVETYPKLGAVKVQADLSGYFTPSLTDNNANDALMRGILKIIEELKTEPIVKSSTPDFVLRNQASEPTNLMKASILTDAVTVDANGVADWGIKNIEADQLWGEPGAQDGVLFGIMDVGFARHEALTFLEFPSNLDVEDHGNHVAGIACGRRGDSKGLHGVLPNCFIRARAADVFFKSAEAGQVMGFFVTFSQVLGTLNKFLDQYDDIKVINVSMGYNWEPNFGINPDATESSQWRSLVESQGTILVSALELAGKAGKVIFSAAGNDSSGLSTPIGAKYASPFNWAAITAREKGISRSGVIVEAHDASNKRAAFSNVGGHVSCPGVDITSSVAHDSSGNPSPSQYGKMSGTSMASPYCASAHVLLSLVRPGYSPDEITDCLLSSTVKSDTGVPIPKLTQALAKCPPR
jgi:subtilisin family serine protease